MEEKDIVIIGAGPAGLSAAIYTQPDGWSTLILEANWVGGQGAIAWHVANYPGFPPGDGTALIENMEQRVISAPPMGVGADLRMERVLSIDTQGKIIKTEANQYKAKAIILATGSTMQMLGIPDEEKFIGKGVSYFAKHDFKKFTGKKVLVIGGGNTTAKSALLAKSEASSVTLLHRRESLRAYPLMVKRLQKEGVEVLYNTEVKKIKGSNKVEAAIVINNKTGEEQEVAAEWIVICVGTEPKTELAREAGIEMAGNFIKVDNRMMTSKDGIFACGEITGTERHLINSAAAGASAGMSASEYLALEKVRNGEMFSGSINGKYADEYLAVLDQLKGG